MSSNPRRLTLADVARHPRPGLTAPRRTEFTPDGSALLYLYSDDNSLVQQLWRFDLASGAHQQVTGDGHAGDESFSLEEQLRRERSRLRERGVTDYQCQRDPTGDEILLVPLGGLLHLRRGDGPLQPLAGTEGALTPRLSPDAAWVAFARDDELWVVETTGATPPRQLTTGGGDGITNGLAEFVAQEEMGRQEGFWWSPDSQSLAYEWADSRHIPIYPIVHQGQEQPQVEEHRYPFAGMPNAHVRLGVIPVAGGATRWLDLGPDDDRYLARVAWRPDGALTAQVVSRDQQTLRLLLFDGENGGAQVLIEERGAPWINLGHDTRFLQSGDILWSSERTGFRHLFLYDASGQCLRQLTDGEWMITAVVAEDEEAGVVYFHATRESPLERHLYAVSLNGGPIRQIDTGAGWHEAVVSTGAGLYLDRWSSLEAAQTLIVRRLDDNHVRATLWADATLTGANLGLQVPELTSFQTTEGETLYAAVYAPPGAAESDRRYPLIVSVYGGPHAQTVINAWGLTIDLRAQYLAQQGFVVLKVDNRGSANRGLAFEGAIARDLGRSELADQVAGARWLARRPWVDGERVGIYGWSYGGYMTCSALCRAPELFKVGVAGAPVTAWDGYDTHYTERYMGSPQNNAAGYAASAVLSHVAQLSGRLLLIHGMVDENVHFRHTARLIVALTAANKDYDLAIFPEERHMPRDARGLEYLERRVTEYFQTHL